MSDRLKELQRQRALIQDQLALLDREIAAARNAEASAGVAPTAAELQPATPATNPSPSPRDQLAEISADEIIAQYQNEARSIQSTVKRGCFLYFFLALGLLILGLAALYFLKTRR